MNVEIRPPLPMRIFAYAFLALWVAACGYVSAKALPHLSAVVPLAMLIGGGFFCWRIASVVVRSEGTSLVVRDIYRSRRISAGQILQVRTGRGPAQPLGRTVFIVTPDEVVALDFGSFVKSRRGAEQDRAMLEAWLAAVRDSTPPA